MNESRSRAQQLLATLTLDEKIGQVSCYFASDISDLSALRERFPHGVGHVSCLELRAAATLDEAVAFQREVQSTVMSLTKAAIPATFHMEGLSGAHLPGATTFPSGMGRGASWDPELEERVGAIVGRQERAVGITQTFAPVLDVSHDPRLGRTGEAYGEDSTLVATLGAAFTRGVQGHDDEGRRTDAVAKHFLASHHVTGGIHGADADLSERRLHETYATPFLAAIREANLRGIMPSYNSIGGEPASASRRLLTTLLRDTWGFDGLIVSDYAAIENLHSVQRVAESLGDAGLAAMTAGLDVELPTPGGYSSDLRERFETGAADLAHLDAAVLRVLESKVRMGLFETPFSRTGDSLAQEFSHADDTSVSITSARESLVLLTNDGVLPLATTPRRIAVIGPHAMSARFMFGGYSHYVMAEALLASASSMAGVTVEQSENAKSTIPGTGVERSDDPAFEELMTRQKPDAVSLVAALRERFASTSVAWVQGYPIAGADGSAHADALALAADADLVIVTLGGKHGTASIATTGEGIDATQITLPETQDVFLAALGRLGKPTVGIHFDGRPISSDAADEHLSALIEAWSPGEHGARAIVELLCGDFSPSGRLPVTVARSAGQLPLHYAHPHGSAWHQGASVGFPEYVDAPHSARYCFGHGLSYATFLYEDLRVGSPTAEPGEQVEIELVVTNTGTREATEVVQLYASDRYASVSRPVQQLIGFTRITLDAGQSVGVRFALDVRVMAFLDAGMQWRVEAGAIDLAIGSSSQDLRVTGEVEIASTAAVDGSTRPLWAEASSFPL